MKRFIAGAVVGLLLSAAAGKADMLSYEGIKLLTLEVQRIANALDRLVSVEAKKLELAKGQVEALEAERNK